LFNNQWKDDLQATVSVKFVSSSQEVTSTLPPIAFAKCFRVDISSSNTFLIYAEVSSYPWSVTHISSWVFFWKFCLESYITTPSCCYIFISWSSDDPVVIFTNSDACFPFLLRSIAFFIRQIVMSFMRNSSPRKDFGIFSNLQMALYSKSHFVSVITEAISCLGLNYLIYWQKFSFWISKRSLNWKKWIIKLELVFLRSKTIFFRLESSFECKRVNISSTLSQCFLNISSRFFWIIRVLIYYFVYLSWCCWSLTLSVTSLIITVNLFFPSTSTLVFVSITVR